MARRTIEASSSDPIRGLPILPWRRKYPIAFPQLAMLFQHRLLEPLAACPGPILELLCHEGQYQYYASEPDADTILSATGVRFVAVT